MKKTTRKLSLSRETLRHLEKGTLLKVTGAAVTQQLNCFTVHATCRCTSIQIDCTTTI